MNVSYSAAATTATHHQLFRSQEAPSPVALWHFRSFGDLLYHGHSESKRMPRSTQNTLPRVISLVLQGLSKSHEDLCVFLMRDIRSPNNLTCHSQPLRYHSFLLFPVPDFSPDVASSPANFIGSLLPDCTGPFPALINNAIVATRASLTSRIIAAHASDQACMLMLPNGALGNDKSHSA